MKDISVKKCLYALIGLFLICNGVAFNAMAKLGNDPVGIFYDGIRNSLGLDPSQLGIASNIINILLVVVIFFIGRKYINIGTILYLVPYGLFVDIGTRIFSKIFVSDILVSNIIASILGCCLIYMGVAIYIHVNIGLDPMIAIAMMVSEKFNLEFKKAKIFFDISLIVIGVVLGGGLGIVTLITCITAGPTIQYFGNVINKLSKNKNFLLSENC